MPIFLWLIWTVLVIFLVSVVSRMLWLNSYVRNLPRIPLSLHLSFLRPNKTSVELYQCLEKITNYCDGLAYFWMGTKLAILCDDPANIKTILMSKDCINRPNFYRMMPGTGNGILTANGNSKRYSSIFEST